MKKVFNRSDWEAEISNWEYNLIASQALIHFSLIEVQKLSHSSHLHFKTFFSSNQFNFNRTILITVHISIFYNRLFPKTFTDPLFLFRTSFIVKPIKKAMLFRRQFAFNEVSFHALKIY